MNGKRLKFVWNGENIIQINDLRKGGTGTASPGTPIAIGKAYTIECENNNMANTQLFQTRQGAFLPAADAVNHVQAPAYVLAPRHHLESRKVEGGHRVAHAGGTTSDRLADDLSPRGGS